MVMPRMRTLPKAVEEIRRMDPDSAFTLHALQRLVKQGKIPVTKVESRRLVNLNQLLEYLSAPEEPLPEVEPIDIHPIKI